MTTADPTTRWLSLPLGDLAEWIEAVVQVQAEDRVAKEKG